MSISALKEKFNSLTLESENHWDYRGNNNSERDYVHGFCTYPAMMVPKMQREMLDVCLEHLQDTSIRLLDPFAGSGTILVEGMLRGLNIVGIDINPLAILLCKAKTTILNPTTLHEKTVQLFTWITIHDKTPLYKFDGINKWFTNQAISDLSRIRAGIIAEETIEYRRFFWASFCEVVRIVSNSRDCTYKLHIKEKKDIDAYAEERDIILAFLEGLKSEGQIIEYRTFSSTTEANLFDIKEAGMTEGAILWLLDRNFSRVGESEEAGLKFAENILKRENASQNYIYILSAVEPATGLTEDGIEEEFDKVLAANCLPDTHSFIYFISKRRLQTKDNTKIAKSLSQGFKRKACFELFQLFNSCLCDGVSTASSKVQRIRQKTLNYLFANKASVRGESYIEVAARLVQIFHQDEYNKAIAGQHSLIAEKAHYYEKLCAAITETVGNEQALTSTLKEYRDIELYNKHINAQHCEIATGDIFKIGSSYFLLVSQACDTCLRSDGHRKLEFASLLEIQDNKQTKFSYPLSCFLDMQKPVVMYHALKIIPFDILDLCVFNGSGQASVVLNDIASFDSDLEAYTNNYRIRFGEVLETVKAVQSNRAKLESFLSGGADITAEDAKAAYEYLEGVDSNMKKFDSIEIAISFPVRRIARLNELTTIDIVKEYGIALSRIGHPFDFSGEISAFE